MKKLCFSILVTLIGLAAPHVAGQTTGNVTTGPAHVNGAWSCQLKTPQGEYSTTRAILRIQQDGAKLTGTFEFAGGSEPLTGDIQGTAITFSTHPHPDMLLVFKGTVKGNKMSGKTSTNKPWKATRY